MLHDLKFGARMLRKNPGFTLLAVLTLALGIGAATTIFSVIYNVLFDPFPYKDANKVVALQIRRAETPEQTGRGMFQTPEFLDYIEQSQVFEEVIAGGFDSVLYTTTYGTELLSAGLLSVNNFSFLGVPAAVGRTLLPEDAEPGAPPVFVMSYKMWRNHFDLDPDILGRTLTLNGIPTTLVGIMPRRFTKLNSDLYMPITLDRADPAVNNRFFMFQARLKPGISMQQAEAELEVVSRRLSEVYPGNYPPDGRFFVKLVSWVDNILGQFRKTLYLLGAAVGVLLLIACSNVANMLLARAAVREKEMSIRTSLGAGRSRLVRQLFVESLLLAILGMAVGVVFAHAGVKILASVIPDGAIPHEAQIRLNGPVLLFSVGIAGLTALIFGLIPALQTARKDLASSLKDARKGGGGGSQGGKLRTALAVFEVALSIVLLAGAGLLMRSFVSLTSTDLGFEPGRILVARLTIPFEENRTREQRLRELLPRLRALPGVIAAATGSSIPPYRTARSNLDIPGKERTEEAWETAIQLCSEGYFETLGLRLLRGRLFDEMETAASRRVAVVNQAFVQRYFPNEDPLGRRVNLERIPARPEDGSDGLFEIVGVVSDTRNQGIEESPMPETFVPFGVTEAFDRGIMLRTPGDPRPLINSVRQEIWAVDRGIAVTLLDSIEGLLKQYTYARPRFTFLVLAVFAGVGLALVALGVYSVIAYTVSRRTQEIGIRMALGAQRGDVLWLVLRQGLTLAALGIAIGVPAALALIRVLKTWLFEAAPVDPWTFVAVAALLLGVTLVACWIPARRATKVDPMTALRYE